MNKTESTRIGFMQGLDALAEKDNRIMLVCADSLLAMRATDFVEKYPGSTSLSIAKAALTS